MDERNLSDQEVALILRKATELQEQTGDRAPADGLSLATVRDIASEIGVEPRFIDQAVAALSAEVRSPASGLLGPPVNSSTRLKKTRRSKERRLLLDQAKALYAIAESMDANSDEVASLKEAGVV